MKTGSKKVAARDGTTSPANILATATERAREIEDGTYTRLSEFVWWRLAKGESWDLVLGYFQKRLQLLRVPRRGEHSSAELHDIASLSQKQRESVVEVLTHGMANAIEEAQDSYDDCDERSRW